MVLRPRNPPSDVMSLPTRMQWADIIFQVVILAGCDTLLCCKFSKNFSEIGLSYWSLLVLYWIVFPRCNFILLSARIFSSILSCPRSLHFFHSHGYLIFTSRFGPTFFGLRLAWVLILPSEMFLLLLSCTGQVTLTKGLLAQEPMSTDHRVLRMVRTWGFVWILHLASSCLNSPGFL